MSDVDQRIERALEEVDRISQRTGVGAGERVDRALIAARDEIAKLRRVNESYKEAHGDIANRASRMRRQATDEIASLRERLEKAEADVHTLGHDHVDLLNTIRPLLASPPSFRDYTGTDDETCGYCHEPIGPPRGKHDPACPWVLARAALTEKEDPNAL